MRDSITSFVLAVALTGTLTLGTKPTNAQYKQKNLVSNAKGHAIHTDPNLINGWGLAFFPHGPFWVADNGTGVSTVYGRHGKPNPLVVTIPAAPGLGIGSPTGMIANPTSEFVISKNGKSAPALFIFATVDGTISGWNPAVNPDNAVIVVDFSKTKPKRPFPAAYYGLTVGTNGKGQTILYAADGGISLDINNDEIDMFDANFNYLGSFTDPHPPAQMAVYGVQNVRGKLYVPFAGFGQNQGGAVDVFDTDGKLHRRFAENSSEGPLQAPWGVVLAPHDFGIFSNDLLIGNVQGGRINAFDPRTGAFLGEMRNRRGDPIEIEGLWALAFGIDEHENGKTNQLFFTAGPAFPPHTAEYADGLFGVITQIGDDDDDHPELQP
jgi:uncharacterized protein (TIGR03118 family)